MSPALGSQIVSFLRTEHKPVYRATLEALGKHRKLRLQFLQKKNRDDQDKFILENLKSKMNEVIGEQVLQVWLMKAKGPMLASFLDGLGIEHDGNGAVDGEIPTSFEADKVKSSLNAVLEKFPAEEVTVYMHLFQMQQPGGWAEVAEVVAAEPRLKLGA